MASLSTIFLFHQLNTSWKDDRVTLIQLSNNSLDNKVNKKIWTPEYWFSNGLFDDNVDYLDRANVIEKIISQKNGAGKPGVIGSYEGNSLILLLFTSPSVVPHSNQKGSWEPHLIEERAFLETYYCTLDSKPYQGELDAKNPKSQARKTAQ